MALLSSLARMQRSQQLATQTALRLGSLNFAMNKQNTSKCRQLERELEANRLALADVESRATEQHAELERLRAQLFDACDDSHRQHAELLDKARSQEESLAEVQLTLGRYRARLHAVQSQQRSVEGAISISVVLVSAWLTALPMTVVSALLRLIVGKRTRATRAVGAAVAATRICILAWLIARIRRGLQRLGLLDPQSPRVQVSEMAGALHQRLQALVSCQSVSSSAARTWSLAAEMARMLVRSAHDHLGPPHGPPDGPPDGAARKDAHGPDVVELSAISLCMSPPVRGMDAVRMVPAAEEVATSKGALSVDEIVGS
jgi:hypothetical protein